MEICGKKRAKHMGFCCFSRMASKRSFQQERKGFHMFHHTESSSIKPVEFQIRDGLPGDQNDTSWISVGRHRFGVFVGPAYIPSNGKNKVQSCMGDVKGTPSPIRKRRPLFTQVSWVTGWGRGAKWTQKNPKIASGFAKILVRLPMKTGRQNRPSGCGKNSVF